MIGDMQRAKKSWLWDLTTKVWDVLDVIIFTVLGSWDCCQLYCSSCGLSFYLKAFPEEDEQQADCLSLLKDLSFLPPSCQHDYPARCIWLTCSSPHNRPESVTLGLSLPLAFRHMGPDSKCHVVSLHGIETPLRAGNPNRWLKCLQQDSPRQPGRGTEPCRW